MAEIKTKMRKQKKVVQNKTEIQPLVSIIIATYRRESSLERALFSLLNQTYKYIELIVVDDNAEQVWNKKVEKIIEKLKQKTNCSIKYIKNKDNQGSAKTRNIGIRRAKGDYITFLDDDDMYLPNKVKNQLEFMIEKNSDFSLTDLHLYSDKEKLIEIRNRKYIEKYEKEDLMRYHLMYHLTGTDAMMFKKDYLVRIGSFPNIDVGDEFYLMQKAIEAGGKFSYVPICDLKAYVHTNTQGLSSGESKVNGENELFEYKKQFFPQLDIKAIKYIKMRHYAVLAFAEVRRKKIPIFLKYSLLSFLSDPVSFIQLIVKRK